MLRRRAFLGLGLAVAVATLIGCGMSAPASSTTTLSLQIAHVAGKALDISSANGAISVRRAEGEVVQVVAKPRATSQERLERVKVLAGRGGDGTLMLRVEWPEGGRHGNEGCDFDVTLPDAFGLNLTTFNGPVEFHGLAGPARIRTSNGSVTSKRHQGPVDAESSNGDIVLRHVGGPIAAESSNGEIDVLMSPDAPGPVKIHSSNGEIRLTLSAAFEGSIRLDTSNGAIRVADIPNAKLTKLGDRQALIQIGDDKGQESILQSSNGSIELRPPIQGLLR